MTYYLMFMGIAKCDDVENKWEKALVCKITFTTHISVFFYVAE